MKPEFGKIMRGKGSKGDYAVFMVIGNNNDADYRGRNESLVGFVLDERSSTWAMHRHKPVPFNANAPWWERE